MAGRVFFSVTMSLDGFIAPESLEDLMGQQWMELQQWIFPQRFFRENLKLGEGGRAYRGVPVTVAVSVAVVRLAVTTVAVVVAGDGAGRGFRTRQHGRRRLGTGYQPGQSAAVMPSA